MQAEMTMSDRLELLCAEICAIDYFEWHYGRAAHRRESDEISHELRLERRERLISEIQVVSAKARQIRRNSPAPIDLLH